MNFHLFTDSAWFSYIYNNERLYSKVVNILQIHKWRS